VATANTAHAEGSTTTASGVASHAEGFATNAIGAQSHAEGNNTTAAGANSHTEGLNTQTTVSGVNAHAEGEGNTASGRASHVEGGGVDPLGNPAPNLASGAAAHAEGVGTLASGFASHAEGGTPNINLNPAPQALGDFSHAEGVGTTASGNTSHAEGFSTTASGTVSHAEGVFTNAIGDVGSHAEGVDTTSSGFASHAEGLSTNASGNASHAEGEGSVASGNRSHAEGHSTISSGEASHAEGNATIASGGGSHAEGQATIADGSFSHAEGNSTTTNGFEGAHIMGLNGAVNAVDGDPTYSWNVAFGAEPYDTTGLVGKLLNNGNMFIDGAYGTPAGDYAEMFETADGNPIDVGYFVVASNEDKIQKATSTDLFILGITSATPGVLGKSGGLRWQGKYQTDEWERRMYHEVTIPASIDGEGNIITPEKKIMQPILNPDWNPNQEYVSRINRQEWVAVGLIGQIRVRDDGTCETHGYCWPNDDGVATKAEKGYYVLKRTGPNQVLVLVTPLQKN
jgi:hypothetical protein